MASEPREITCPMCGFKNPESAARCRSCGARVEPLTGGYATDEAYERRHQQDHFEWRWAAIACGLYLVAQWIVLVPLQRVIPEFDPQGLPGLIISAGIWFLGSVVVGAISPGKTFLEPAVGAAIAVIPTIVYLEATTPAGFEPTTLAYTVTALFGVMLALFGAFLGEKLQRIARGGRDRQGRRHA